MDIFNIEFSKNLITFLYMLVMCIKTMQASSSAVTKEATV